jgi:hypothetical protein
LRNSPPASASAFSGVAESIGPMWAIRKHRKPAVGVPPPICRARGPLPKGHGGSASRSSSAMSLGRPFLDRVARQQSPSPLHGHPQITATFREARRKADISTLLWCELCPTFALTSVWFGIYTGSGSGRRYENA